MSEMWDGVAPAWERNADTVDEHMAAATEALLDAAGVAAGAEVLDIGCGPGGAGLAAAARTGPSGRVVLADAAPEMVATAARRAAARPGVETAVCDLAAIDAPDASFDAVVCRHALMLVEDPVAAVREAARVLRPGGRYAAITWDRQDANPWLGVIFDAVGAQFGVPFPPPGMAGPFALGDRDRLAGVLADGGLEGVEVHSFPAPMRADSLDTWWTAEIELAGPLAAAFENLESDVRDAIRARAVEAAAAAARPHGDGIELDGSVLVASGRRA